MYVCMYVCMYVYTIYIYTSVVYVFKDIYLYIYPSNYLST